uniref:Serine protease n=1 Tax=Sparus aurata TaxID=8175 RepID=A0A671UFL1_SPAAU
KVCKWNTKKQKYNELNCPDENLVIKLGGADDCIVATHFPSSCVTLGEVLTISCESETVEEAQIQPAKAKHSRDRYSVFYIHTVGGTNAKTKKLFKHDAVKKFTYVCVYGEKGTTVEEALQRDGRFSDDLCNFTLSNNENPKCFTEPVDNVDSLNGKKFKICLPRKKRANYKKQQENTGIYTLLCDQYPALKELMQMIVKDVREGTGFVLFDNFVLTNKGVEVSVLFNYDDPEPGTNYCYFEVVNFYIYLKVDGLDYAVLELNTEGQRIPPGLLKDFGPRPQNGSACLIGHPGGELKKMDPTCIIEKEKRGQAVEDHLHQYRDSHFILHSISRLIREQGIENIMIGGKLAENRSTYHTPMYHGSSGSPVFDSQCKVFGLHTGGFVYRQNLTESVMDNHVKVSVSVLCYYTSIVGCPTGTVHVQLSTEMRFYF